MKIATILSCFFFCLILKSQDKFKIEVETNYIHQPFNQFNLLEGGSNIYDVNITKYPAYSFGLGIKRVLGNDMIGIKYSYFNARFDIDYEIKGLLGDVILEGDRSFVFNNSFILGINYGVNLNKFYIEGIINLMAFQQTRKNIISGRNLTIDGSREFLSLSTIEENLDIQRYEIIYLKNFRDLRLVPEIKVQYELVKNLSLQAGMFLDFFGRKEAYNLTIRYSNTIPEIYIPITDDLVISNEITLKDRLVAPYIGISYNFGFGNRK